jgi:hypothetical protein
MKVWVLHISHRHGTNIYPCASEEAARLELFHFVSEWWSEVSDEDMPDDHSEAIEEYFEKKEDEHFDLGCDDLVGYEPHNRWIIVSLATDQLTTTLLYNDEADATVAADDLRSCGVDCVVKGFRL